LGLGARQQLRLTSCATEVRQTPWSLSVSGSSSFRLDGSGKLSFDLGEAKSDTNYEQKKELLRIKIAKLDNGNTSFVFCGRNELMSLLDG